MKRETIVLQRLHEHLTQIPKGQQMKQILPLRKGDKLSQNHLVVTVWARIPKLLIFHMFNILLLLLNHVEHGLFIEALLGDDE